MLRFLKIFSLLITGLAAGVQGQNAPQRIVSLAPSLTRALYYLDAKDRLVGVTSFCNIARNDNKEVVATAIAVNVERVITLRPDLVVTTAMTNPETIDLLRRAGIKTEVFQTPRSFEEICTQFERLGTLAEKRDNALKINDSVSKRVAEIKALYSFRSKPSFFFQIGANPLFTVLENTFMDDYITFFGGKNIAAGLTRGTLNREYVLTANPDVIIIVNMGITSDEEKKVWERYPFLKAVKNNRIFFIESDMASTPNPPDFLKTLEAMSQYLKPGWWKD